MSSSGVRLVTAPWRRSGKGPAHPAGRNILTEPHLDQVEVPSNLRINDRIKSHRQACSHTDCQHPLYHFAFGQSPFSPPPSVIDALREHASEHDYLPSAGIPALRDAVARFYRHHFRMDIAAERVIVSPGSKEMISILLAALEGPVLIPTPSWVSYMPQARILQKRVVPVPLLAEDGFKLTPERLLAGLRDATARQAILILNHPHNPTGAVYDRRELDALARICRDRGVVVIADEIYALTAFENKAFTSMGESFPEGTIITGGLSKDRGSGGYRVGVAAFPTAAGHLYETAIKIASATYSSVAAPMQHAAIQAYSLDEDVERHIRDCRAVNRIVGETVRALLSQAGIETPSPQGGFYVFLDWSDHREAFAEWRLTTNAAVAAHVLQVAHVALLPGSALLLNDGKLAFRCSYVDYDGNAALADFRVLHPETDADKEDFVRRNCPRIVGGIASLGRYLEQVRSGKLPRHE